jgi:hypothetical protein
MLGESPELIMPAIAGSSTPLLNCSLTAADPPDSVVGIPWSVHFRRHPMEPRGRLCDRGCARI